MPSGGEHCRTEEVGWIYLSFMDEEVFQGVDLPKGEGSNPPVPTTTDIAATADIPGTTNAQRCHLYQRQL